MKSQLYWCSIVKRTADDVNKSFALLKWCNCVVNSPRMCTSVFNAEEFYSLKTIKIH